jgi:SAP domain
VKLLSLLLHTCVHEQYVISALVVHTACCTVDLNTHTAVHNDCCVCCPLSNRHQPALQQRAQALRRRSVSRHSRSRGCQRRQLQRGHTGTSTVRPTVKWCVTLPAAPQRPREFGDFSGLAKAPLAPREERREREYKKKLEARQRKESGEFNSMIKRSAAQRQAAGPEEGVKRSRPGWTPVPLPFVFDESDVRYTGERKQQQQQQGDEFEPFEDDDFSEFDDIAAAAGSGSSSRGATAANDDKWNSQLDAGLDLDLGSDDLFAALMDELKADAPPAAAQQQPQRRAPQPAVAAALPDAAVPLGDDDLFAGLMSELGAFDELDDDAPPAAASLQPQQRRAASPAAAGRSSSSSELDADLDLDLGSDDMFAALMEELRADAPPVAATSAAAAAPKRGAAAPATDSFAGLMSDAGAFDSEDTALAAPAAQGRVTAESTLDELDAASAFEGEYGFDAGYDDEQNTVLSSSSFESSSDSSAAAARSGGASSRAVRAAPTSAGASRAQKSEVDELDSFLAMLDDSEGADLFEALEQQQEQQPRAATPAAAPASAAAALPMRPAEELSFADAANDVPLELPDSVSSSGNGAAAGAQSVAAASAGTGSSAGLSPEVVPQLKVSELKEQLKARGLKVSGKKDELVERLLVAVQSS